MEEKLAEMDTIVSKLDTLEAKVEKYRPKTAQEKLQLRSLDSGPFKQNLADFFDEKKDEMEQTGKNEYVLTQDEVESFSPSDIEKSFNEPMEDEDDILLNKFNS
jgi:superfamily II DNA or RNA helicase